MLIRFKLAYQVELLNFTGPLDLLLQLIERSRLEVTDISLAQVTAQYLGYINQLQDLEPSELNWFIDLATKLIYLKSQALVPTLEVEVIEEELADLERQLEEFGHYQKAAEYLQSLLATRRVSWQRPAAPKPLPQHLPTPPLTFEQLAEAFQATLKRMPAPNKLQPPTHPGISLDQMVARIKQQLHTTSTLSLTTLLRDLKNRGEAVVLFLALLELIKYGQVQAYQNTQFEDILLSHVS